MNPSCSVALSIAAFATVGLSASAQAGTVYNNLGAGNTFSNSGRIIQGPDVNNIGDVDQAARFNTGGFNREGITVSAGINVTGPTPRDGRGPLAVQIWSDGGATGPQSVLATTTLNPNTFGDQLITTTFGALTLNANTNYWVVLNGLTVFDGGWRQNNTGAVGVTAGRTGNGAWSGIRDPDPDGMLSLQVLSRVDVVPEPAPLAALGLGAVTLLRRRRKV